MMTARALDTHGLHHRTMGEGPAFVCTDSVLFDRGLVSIDRSLHAIAHAAQVDVAVVELARGVEPDGRRNREIDISYARFMTLVSHEFLRPALFLYLAVPFSERLRRNADRLAGGEGPPQSVLMSLYATDDLDSLRVVADCIRVLHAAGSVDQVAEDVRVTVSACRPQLFA